MYPTILQRTLQIREPEIRDKVRDFSEAPYFDQNSKENNYKRRCIIFLSTKTEKNPFFGFGRKNNNTAP